MSEVIYGVTGATGHLGQLAIDQLLKMVDASQIIAIVRNEVKAEGLKAKGVTVRVALYQDSAALNSALEGVDKLLLISSSDMTSSRYEQHKNVIDAAKQQGVGYIAYTSILAADSTTNPLAPDHKATEEYLQASGLAYSYLRHGWYHENYFETVKNAASSGIILTSAGEGRVSSASRADYAAGDVLVLTSDAPKLVYEFAGDQAWNFGELAATIQAIVGKEVLLRSVSNQEQVAQLVSIGLDNDTARFVAGIDTSIADGGLENNDKELSTVIGRPTTPLQDSLESAV